MTKRQQDPDNHEKPAGVNPGYAAFQIARALKTSETHEDRETRERAAAKIATWERVLRSILSGSVAYGSRTPVEGVPAWATLEVVTGGFATGALLAGGPLQDHELELLEDRPEIQGSDRLALNTYFLTDPGLAQLKAWLQTGCFDVNVPEEGAYLVVAWLVANDYAEEARALVEELSPHFANLRFYPIPLEQPRRFSARVHVQDVGTTIANLRRIRPNQRLLAQQETVNIWLPLYDRIVALFLETVEDDWPCRHYPDGWSTRALALLGEYAELRREHQLSSRLERPNGHYAQLRVFLGKCARQPDQLSGREVGRIRLILKRYTEKRGAPTGPACLEARRRQAADVSGPSHREIMGVVVARLNEYDRPSGLDQIEHVVESLSAAEAAASGLPAGTAVPPSIQRKVERCLHETVAVLVGRGLITSGETLARVLPQMTAGLRAAGIIDPTLRRLYAAIYRAFRRRRSLLLLNLEKQVRLGELPWVAAIDRFRSDSLSDQELSRQTLEEVTILALTSFPQAILPNKLLGELRALATGAALDLPLVDELATDIFMGQFSGKFIDSARRAADLLDGSLYATYYDINYGEVRKIPKARATGKHSWFRRSPRPGPDGFAQICASRAGVALGTWDPATNGMIIEQQQILTTQNLAALFGALDLTATLQDQLAEMARQCFRWICQRQQMKTDRWHARLIMIKNTAYAWRQLIFFLALLPERDVATFLQWAEGHLSLQSEAFQHRFRPVLDGLVLATAGHSLTRAAGTNTDARRFLGWSNNKHWLLE